MPRCRICKALYTRTRAMQPTCGRFECQVEYAEQAAEKHKSRRDKQSKREEREDRAKVRARLDALKTVPQLIAEADSAFCAYIRERDKQAGYPCISSGRPLDWSGNAVDAGHYRSRGAASHLRYDEANCHAQSKHDNRYLAGNIVAYRAGLIDRIGLDEVERIENDNSTHKWTREELLEIIEEYKDKLRQIKKTGKQDL